MSDCLEFSVKVLRGTDVVGSSSKGSDDAVLGGVSTSVIYESYFLHDMSE